MGDEAPESYLYEEPNSIGQIPPPVSSSIQLLPLGQLTVENFERLCLRLAEKQGEVEDASLYGVPGQEQGGVDIFVRRGDGSNQTIQSRRYQKITAGDIRGAVDDFLEGQWAEKSRSFVLAMSADGRRTELVDERDTQAKRLEEKGISFELWDRDGLSRRLKDHPDLVGDLFGRNWVEAFCPNIEPIGQEATERLADAVAARLVPRVIILGSDTAESVQRAVEKLNEEVPNEVGLIEGLLSGSRTAERVAQLIQTPSVAIAQASWQVWAVFARIAERGGEWGAASMAWERISAMRGGEVRALTNAAIGAKIGGDEERAEGLLLQAEERDPTHPKVVMERVNEIEDANERLAKLEGVESEDDQENALLACHRALAHLQLDRLDEAATEIESAMDLAPQMVQVQIIGVNLSVHRGRTGIVQGTSLNDVELRDAERKALELRDQLLPQRRFGETGRLLMLASDAAALRYEVERVDAILAMATEDELQRAEEASALANAAVRARQWHRAIEFSEFLEDNAERTRIRAVAWLALGENAETAIRELKELVEGDSEERRDAALALLMHAAFHGGEWSEVAAEALQEKDEEQCLLLRGFYLAESGDYQAAKELLTQHRNQRKIFHTLFNLAYLNNDPDAPALATGVLATNPDSATRMQCARVLFNDGDHVRAEAEARTIAQDATAGIEHRSDGYHLLVAVLGSQDRWAAANGELDCWTTVRPDDPRLGLMRARVGNRLRPT